LIEADPSSAARYLLVGTGRLLADTDIASATSNVQSFYAIIDGTASSGGFNVATTLPGSVTFPIVRDELNAVTDLTVGIQGSTAGKIGWYFDMPVVASGSTYIAQRVDVDPVTTQGVVAWAGNLPNGSACSPAGTGTTYATAFSTGKTVLINSTTGAFINSITNSAGVITEQSFLNVNGTTRLYAGDSSGAISLNSTKIGSSSGVKQLNWRDVPLAN
jgi:type IV pilus assembly protein PilY1